MVTYEDVERIAPLTSDEGILSAYIAIDPKRIKDRRHPATEFKSAFKRFVDRTRDARWREAGEREKPRILDYLETWKPSGRGLAIFSCTPDGIWEVVPLDVPVRSLVDVDTTTRTGILTQILDEYPRFVVAVVQADRARIYVSEQRRAEADAEIESEVPGRHDQGGWAQARFQRHIEFHVEEHLKKVVDELQKLHRQRRFNRLAIGGSEEAVHELLKMLPEPLAKTVIGTFPVDAKHETDEEILDRARALLVEEERRSEIELVDRLLEAAGSKDRGVVGVDETLRAVHEGRVRTLVLADDLHGRGSICLECGYFAAKEHEACPLCGGPTETTSDIIERAAEKAFLTGAYVETVFGEARERLLEHGGIGALLRY